MDTSNEVPCGPNCVSHAMAMLIKNAKSKSLDEQAPKVTASSSSGPYPCRRASKEVSNDVQVPLETISAQGEKEEFVCKSMMGTGTKTFKCILKKPHVFGECRFGNKPATKSTGTLDLHELEIVPDEKEEYVCPYTWATKSFKCILKKPHIFDECHFVQQSSKDASMHDLHETIAAPIEEQFVCRNLKHVETFASGTKLFKCILKKQHTTDGCLFDLENGSEETVAKVLAEAVNECGDKSAWGKILSVVLLVSLGILFGFDLLSHHRLDTLRSLTKSLHTEMDNASILTHEMQFCNISVPKLQADLAAANMSSEIAVAIASICGIALLVVSFILAAICCRKTNSCCDDDSEPELRQQSKFALETYYNNLKKKKAIGAKAFMEWISSTDDDILERVIDDFNDKNKSLPEFLFVDQSDDADDLMDDHVWRKKLGPRTTVLLHCAVFQLHQNEMAEAKSVQETSTHPIFQSQVKL